MTEQTERTPASPGVRPVRLVDVMTPDILDVDDPAAKLIAILRRRDELDAQSRMLTVWVAKQLLTPYWSALTDKQVAARLAEHGHTITDRGVKWLRRQGSGTAQGKRPGGEG